MIKKLLFKINDWVILRNGQKGIIFRLPDCIIDPDERLCLFDENPIYGVLYIDDKGFHFGPYDVDESGMELYSGNKKEGPTRVIPSIKPIHKIELLTCPHCAGPVKVAFYDTPYPNGDHRRQLIEFVLYMNRKINNREVLYLRDTSSFNHPYVGVLEVIRVLVWDKDSYIEINSNIGIRYTPEWLRMLLQTSSDLSHVYQLVDIFGFTNKKKEN